MNRTTSAATHIYTHSLSIACSQRWTNEVCDEKHLDALFSRCVPCSGLVWNFLIWVFFQCHIIVPMALVLHTVGMVAHASRLIEIFLEERKNGTQNMKINSTGAVYYPNIKHLFASKSFQNNSFWTYARKICGKKSEI